jgi:uncharacterized protein (TIRG00374 family)
MKSALQWIGGLLLAAFLLYWCFRDQNPREIWNALLNASWLGLALGAAINIAHNVFRVFRWRWLLAPVRERVPLRPMFASVILGYMTTWLLPLRLGELVRPALLSAKENLPLGPCLGTVVADRLLDGVAIVALFAVGSLTAHFTAGAAALAGEIRSFALLALALIALGLGGLIAMSRTEAKLGVWLSGRGAAAQWIGRALLRLSQGLDALHSPRRLIPILAHSLLAWATIGLGTWVGIRAAGADVGFADVLVMLPLLALGVSLPTPGGVGGYQWSMYVGLTSLFGVDPAIAAGAGILMHVAIVIPVLILGPILLYTEKLSWSDLVAAGRQVRALGHQEPTAEVAR